jgi:hypothetical protein
MCKPPGSAVPVFSDILDSAPPRAKEQKRKKHGPSEADNMAKDTEDIKDGSRKTPKLVGSAKPMLPTSVILVTTVR